MKTRFSAIVKYKHSKMQESEAELQKALKRLQDAKDALEKSLRELESFKEPQNGNMQDFLASRTLLDAQMRLIEKNRAWVAFEKQQSEAIREKFKQDMIEYEKFKYLEAKEIESIKQKLKRQESKLLDEVAQMTYRPREAI